MDLSKLGLQCILKTMLADHTILNGPLGQWLHFRKGIQGSFHQSFVPIGHVVSEKKIFQCFPIGTYVKTMFTDGDHVGWTSGRMDTILQRDMKIFQHVSNSVLS